MTHDDAERLARIASDFPEALDANADEVRHLCRNWQTIVEALAYCDIGRTDGRVVLTLPERLGRGCSTYVVNARRADRTGLAAGHEVIIP